MDYGALLRRSFEAAVRAADPAVVLGAHLPPADDRRTQVVGAGKAAAAMAAALEAAWPGIESPSGMVVTRYGHGAPTKRIRVLEAGHPLPDEAGLAAASEILRMAGGLHSEDRLLVLLSGGGSSLLSQPPPGISLSDYRDLTALLLRGGVPIDAMNVVRKHVSLTQGGRLAAATRAEVWMLVISDVPGDDLGSVASGPCSPDSSTYEDALAVLKRWNLTAPRSVVEHLEAGCRGEIGETPKPGDACFARVRAHLIACAHTSLAAGAAVLEAAGIRVINLGDALGGEAVDLARAQAAEVHALRHHRRRGGGPVALLSGGECTVRVMGSGRGGRNSEFLLHLFAELQGFGAVHALACDTDGIDGSENNAGAQFNDASYALASRRGLDARSFLKRNDAYSFFEALDGLIVTGPTRTNVNDYRCVLVG